LGWRLRTPAADLGIHVTPDWASKVDAWVLQTAQEQGETEFLISLSSQADLSGANLRKTRLEKGEYVVSTLREHAARTQAPLLAELNRLGLEHRAYWITNVIWVRGDLADIQRLALHPDVARLYANPRVQLEMPEPAALPAAESLAPTDTTLWNLEKVNADDLWALGITGEGVVIGGQDTGYQWDHPALKNQYRGWNGAAADHNYNWHDAIHANTGANSCGYDTLEPCDDYGHGTHTMGTMVGKLDENTYGMAPGAKWIGCRNMDEGVGQPSTYIECYQWFIAPTDLGGQNADPSKAPHIINNSWSCPTTEGCTESDVLLEAVQNVRSAGILTVHSAGNAGPYCGSVNTPAAIYDESFTVGNTDSYDAIAGSSSRGPVLVDGSGRMKPDISAPGTGIYSTYPTNTYTNLSGTSMAAPHVAGLAALLISARPDLAGNVNEIERIITRSALSRTSLEGCGGVPGSQVPNNTYGWGRIDARSALDYSWLSLQISEFPTEINPSDMFTYTIQATNQSTAQNYTDLVLIHTLPDFLSFISATGPYTQTGATLNWDFSQLSAGSSIQVTVTVQANSSLLGFVTIEDYFVSSPETSTVVKGLPIQSILTGELIFLPTIRNEP
jgi:serine protease AprX